MIRVEHTIKMKNQLKRLLLMTVVAFLVLMASGQTTDSLSVNFQHPPSETKPWVYWYWISDHISKTGITKDLEAMAKVGIGEALIGNVDQLDQKGTVKALTEEWWQMIDFAIREGKRTGVNIGVFNSPGWSQSGGPWIKPEQAMRYLTMSEVRVKGPLKFSGRLLQPTPQFQDVAVIAFAVPLNDRENITTSSTAISSTPELSNLTNWFDGNPSTELYISPSPANTFTLDFKTKSPYTARSLTLFPAQTSFSATCDVQVLQAGGAFATVKSFHIERTNNSTNVGFIPFGPISETFAAVSGTQFRLVFSNINGNAGFTEISLSGAARTERYIEKQLGKLWPTPTPLWDAYLWKAPAETGKDALAVNPQKVINITSHLSKDGKLEWEVPEGEWIIQRIGMTPTGQKNAPASVEATGLEVDKMNSKWLGEHFDAYIGKILKRLPAEDRTAFKHVVADSYETGAENWTDGLASDFKKRYGYDPLPFLPVMFGRVAGNADLSDRFLWDLRRLIADRVSYQYVGALRQKANENGLKLWLENYGHWGYPGEFLQYGGQTDEVSGEFWTGDGNALGSIELKDASSSAHTYGKNTVHSESFTSGGPLWSYEPWSLKKRGDWAATQGINHFILHVYIHQPYEDKVPGVNAWFGTEFNRNNTWFYQSKAWIDYLRRSHYMLQQGHYVADVAYFIGEDAPKMTGIRDPQLPEGYSFDFINAEVIENRLEVKDGRFVLPDGMSYRLLVLPPLTTMRPELLKKIRQLITSGGVVVGQAPSKSPSMENYPDCDKEVSKMAKEIWQNCEGINVKRTSFGAGTVYAGTDLKTVFTDLKVTDDLGNLDNKRFAWIHRSTPGSEIYYLSNQTDGAASCSPSFRVEGRQPELWDPVTGEHRELPDFTAGNGNTVVPLEFAPRESYFVVFSRKTAGSKKNSINFVRKTTLVELNGAWMVSFDTKWGGPEVVKFDKLEDWTNRPEAGIKYYSGTAVYRKNFNLPKGYKKGQLLLNLGEVYNMASVKINGKSLGLVWAEPRVVDMSGYVKSKNNLLEIEVTNTWNNRLVGDAALLVDKRLTSTMLNVNANTPLLPAGLLGPVLIETVDLKLYVQRTEIVADKTAFEKPGSATVTLTCATRDADIRYTLDGTPPTEKSPVYTLPFTVTDYAVISAKGFLKGLVSGDVSTLVIDGYDPVINGLNYACYEGDFNKLPDFSTLSSLKQGTALSLDPSKLKSREDHFALDFKGYLNIPTSGTYTFSLISDDGSKLYMDGILIADNDGNHGEKEVTGTIPLLKGKHVIRIGYFDNTGNETLRLKYSLNNEKAKEFPVSWLTVK